MYTAAIYYYMKVVYMQLARAGHEGTNKLHKKVAQIPIILTPIKIFSVLKHLHLLYYGMCPL